MMSQHSAARNAQGASLPSRRRIVVAVVGPTGSGKSDLSLGLALAMDGEVLSCDALQVYRGLDIGTGKLADQERRGVRHHLLDIVDPDRHFSAAQYIRTAAPIIHELDQHGKLPLVVGGTGLYLRALLHGLFEGPGRSPALRERLAGTAEIRGTPYVHRILRRIDSRSAARIHPNDLVRVIRALEVSLQSKTSMTEMMTRRRSPIAGYRTVIIGLSPPRAVLARRIEARVKRMFASGLVDEVRHLLASHGPEAPAFKAIGYREVHEYLRGELSLAGAIERTVRATVQYAKRQMCWFRRETGIVWFTGGGEDPRVEQDVLGHVRDQLDRLAPAGEEALYAEAAP